MKTRSSGRLPVLVLLLLLLLAPALAADSIRLEKLTVHPDTPENRALVAGLVDRALQLAGRRYAPRVEIAAAGQPASHRLAVAAVLQDDSSVVNVTLAGTGGDERSYALTGKVTAGSVSHLAAAVFHLWGALRELPLGRAPELVDELPTDAIGRSVLPGMPSMLVPTSVAVTPRHSLLVGFSMLCVELQASFALVSQPGRSLYDQGNYGYAFSVASTPAGSVLLKPGSGRELYQIAAGSDKPQRWRLQFDSFGPFAALPDAKVFERDPETGVALEQRRCVCGSHITLARRGAECLTDAEYSALCDSGK